MSEITETEVVKHITNSLNEMYAKGYADGLNSQPQLTIPKSVADMADIAMSGWHEKDIDISWILDNITLFLNDDDTNDFLVWEDETKKSQALMLTYLSGKSLGVELVKVVEG